MIEAFQEIWRLLEEPPDDTPGGAPLSPLPEHLNNLTSHQADVDT